MRANVIGRDVIYVSSLGTLSSVTASFDSFDLLTLLSPDHRGTDWSGFACGRHVRLAFHDIVEPLPGLVAPDLSTMQAILDFGREGTRQRAMLIHCWAGISRSSAAAFAIACDHNPGYERAVADELRRRAAFVTPNRLMVELADNVLGRDGRMVDAIDPIGRGPEPFEGKPYQLPPLWPIE